MYTSVSMFIVHVASFAEHDATSTSLNAEIEIEQRDCGGEIDPANSHVVFVVCGGFTC